MSRNPDGNEHFSPLWIAENGELIHPNAPSGSGGPGFFTQAGPLISAHANFPHPQSPAARHLTPEKTKKANQSDDVLIPSSPLWHMGKAALGSSESFDLLQKAIDYLAKKAKAQQPFVADEKEFMKEIFEALWWGGKVKGYSEAAILADHYVNGDGTTLELDADVYKTSVIVMETMQAMKDYIRDTFGTNKPASSLISSDRDFLKTKYAGILKKKIVNQKTQGGFYDNGLLLAEQNNLRLRNANNRFYLNASSARRGDVFFTTWKVEDIYDFEPFEKGYITNIPLGDFILRLPDGLSQYLTKIGVAKVFNYVSKWTESWI